MPHPTLQSSGSSQALLAQLRELLGTEAVLTDPEATAPYLVDYRRQYFGRSLAVVQPRELGQVSRLLAWCDERRIGVVPQGGNTGYCGAATPDESGSQLLLSMSRLDRIRNVDADNFSLTVEAGCVLQRVQQAAEAAERYFPLSLGSEGSCQIGGNLGTNAGGVHVLRYGMARDLVLGIEAVLPGGRVLSGLKSLRKDNSGYDLKSLLIGSEGTLGVITAATLKLWPKPRSTATAFVAVTDPAGAIRLLARLREACGETVCAFELLPRIAVELTARHIDGVSAPLAGAYEWYALCELSSAAVEPLQELLERVLSELSEAGLVLDAAVASSERVRAAFWRLRETVPEAQRLAGASLKHDIAVPVSLLPPFILEAGTWVHEHVPDGALVCYGHAGDGNLHFNIGHLGASPVAAFLGREPQIRRAVHDLVVRYGGSISAEHGIGRLKREELRRYAQPAALAAMRAIKHALDPHGIMNPGKVL